MAGKPAFAMAANNHHKDGPNAVHLTAPAGGPGYADRRHIQEITKCKSSCSRKTFCFGIVAVDRETQQRTPKPSAYWLGNVARANRPEFASKP